VASRKVDTSTLPSSQRESPRHEAVASNATYTLRSRAGLSLPPPAHRQIRPRCSGAEPCASLACTNHRKTSNASNSSRGNSSAIRLMTTAVGPVSCPHPMSNPGGKRDVPVVRSLWRHVLQSIWHQESASSGVCDTQFQPHSCDHLLDSGWDHEPALNAPSQSSARIPVARRRAALGMTETSLTAGRAHRWRDAAALQKRFWFANRAPPGQAGAVANGAVDKSCPPQVAGALPLGISQAARLWRRSFRMGP
jgi:hypothetical protein